MLTRRAEHEPLRGHAGNGNAGENHRRGGVQKEDGRRETEWRSVSSKRDRTVRRCVS